MANEPEKSLTNKFLLSDIDEIKPEDSSNGASAGVSETNNIPPVNPDGPGPEVGKPEILPIKIDKITGPLVIFFGPRDIGKTTALFRLCEYLEKEKTGGNYDIDVDEGFRPDKDYPEIVRAFNKAREESSVAPLSTGNIDFLLLNVIQDKKKVCQILEAPGEHYFVDSKPDEDYEFYFNNILGKTYKKIFVFFFAVKMNEIKMENYAKKINRLVNTSVSSKRDHVIVVCNKCDEQDYYIDDGEPRKDSYKDELSKYDEIRKLFKTLEKSYGKVSFTPFMSGRFNGRSFAFSGESYPKELWEKIEEGIEGRTWSLLWVFPLFSAALAFLVWFFKEIFPILLDAVLN
jgi:hypothetical protein